MLPAPRQYLSVQSPNCKHVRLFLLLPQEVACKEPGVLHDPTVGGETLQPGKDELMSTGDSWHPSVAVSGDKHEQQVHERPPAADGSVLKGVHSALYCSRGMHTGGKMAS